MSYYTNRIFMSLLLTIVVYGLRLSGLGGLPNFNAKLCRIGVDYGPRLIGLASGTGKNSKPIGHIKNDGDLCRVAREVVAAAVEEGASEILVGLPLDSNGRMSHDVKNLNGRLCLAFSSVLAAVVENECPRLDVFLVDERYTTKEARIRMREENVRGSLDAYSAMCLIERYVEDEGGGRLEAKACTYPIPEPLAQFDYNIVREHIKDEYATPLDDVDLAIIRAKRLKEGSNERAPLSLSERVKVRRRRK